MDLSNSKIIYKIFRRNGPNDTLEVLTRIGWRSVSRWSTGDLDYYWQDAESAISVGKKTASCCTPPIYVSSIAQEGMRRLGRIVWSSNDRE